MTEKERLDAESLKASKLESIGVLAGGIAHDFNNLLTGILGNLSLARMQSPALDRVLNRIAEAEKAATRARDLTHQLLTFARGGEPIKKAVDFATFLPQVCQLALTGSNVQADYRFPDDLWLAEVDEGQFRQVLHNITTNARESMPDGGRIFVAAENVQVTEGVHPMLSPGKYVLISISDTGSGIPEDHLDKVFDPYFTTKERRAGMGLATAFSVVRKHHGAIDIQSSALGTTVLLHLPASRQMELSKPLQASDVTGKGKILIMDDEEDIRVVSAMILESFGYEVEVVQDGAQVIEKYLKARGEGKPFDLLIMDLTIPNGLGGKDAIKRLREIDPAVRAIVSSGYSYDPVMGNYREFGFKGVVPKPYEAEELGRTVQEVLAS
jgi:CheY-like chemotaxis protein